MKKALAVDNDPDILEIITMTLSKKAGFSVDQAEDGEQALEKIKKADGKYDLVVLDVMMPKKSGIDVCKELSKDERFKKIPVILASALPVGSSSFKNSMEAYKELSVVRGVVEKPFSIENFIQEIKKVLGEDF